VTKRKVVQAPTVPVGPVMVKCPGCNLYLVEDDFEAQRLHMEKYHPEIVAERLAEPKKMDGWEDS
jgi:hypothetical protein